jgi:hypothetical protein
LSEHVARAQDGAHASLAEHALDRVLSEEHIALAREVARLRVRDR